jgi:UDP-glucose 4-epimerase
MFVVSRDEAKHWTLRNRLEKDSDVHFLVGDIRDSTRISNILRQVNPHFVILAAALKQVDTCERSPSESIQTNILGISNVVESVVSLRKELSNLEGVLMVSTDKACAPTNVYGMSKAISERLVTSAHLLDSRIRFMGVRYGNVLESRGSIIPLFRHQSQTSRVLTVTHEEMTRFIMTLDQSIDLIEATLLSSQSGEIWLPTLNSMRIMDLAQIFVERYDSRIEVTGIRPGEKIHEELISEPESLRTIRDGSYLKLMPATTTIQNAQETFSYSSKDCLVSRNELESYLESISIFSKPLNQFLGREIDEISSVERK